MDYQSNLVRKKHRHRGIYSGVPYQLSGRIFIPSGTVLATTDNLLFIPVGEKMSVKRVTLDIRGDLGAAQGSIGYFQILDKDGNPVVVERIGPRGDSTTKFTSPATSGANYKAAAALAEAYTETIIATPLALAGPVNIGIDITTGGTAAADTTIFLGVEFDGEVTPQDMGSDIYGDVSYLLD